MLASAIRECHSLTGSWLVTIVERNRPLPSQTMMVMAAKLTMREPASYGAAGRPLPGLVQSPFKPGDALGPVTLTVAPSLAAGLSTEAQRLGEVALLLANDG